MKPLDGSPPSHSNIAGGVGAPVSGDCRTEVAVPRAESDAPRTGGPTRPAARSTVDPYARAPGVLFKDEVATRLRCSERQIDKLEKLGLFPIPRLPSIDKRPRYSAKLVEQYENGELQVLQPAGRRGRGTR